VAIASLFVNNLKARKESCTGLDWRNVSLSLSSIAGLVLDDKRPHRDECARWPYGLACDPRYSAVRFAPALSVDAFFRRLNARRGGLEIVVSLFPNSE
jgi:hypothetical protein